LRTAILILGSTHVKHLVIPAGMPESSHKDVNLQAGTTSRSSTCATDKLPSLALDSGIHAGMTAVLAKMRIAALRKGSMQDSVF
jgi:hypothetical protein